MSKLIKIDPSWTFTDQFGCPYNVLEAVNDYLSRTPSDPHDLDVMVCGAWAYKHNRVNTDSIWFYRCYLDWRFAILQKYNIDMFHVKHYSDAKTRMFNITNIYESC